jgi:heme a synthase
MRVADVFALLLQGLLVASVPLAVVWAFRGQDRIQRLAWLTAFITFDLVVFGAFTRLTDSGLGCPDWPGCFAKANPLAAAGEIENAQRALPGGPVDMQKAWIEMIHRTLAGGVGLLIVTMVVAIWSKRARYGPAALGIALVAVGLVVVQVAFGAYTVTLKLEPVIVTGHLLFGVLLFAVLMWQAATLDARPDAGVRESKALTAFASIGLLLLAVQIALGGWVSTNYAVLACNEYPLCQGQLVPPMDFKDGFSFARALGHTVSGDFLPQAALIAIHWTHRNAAVPVSLVLLLIAAWVWRTTPLRRDARNLALLVLLQWATGLANVLLGWPLLAAVVHSAGACALLGTLVLINYRLRVYPSRASSFVATPPKTAPL